MVQRVTFLSCRMPWEWSVSPAVNWDPPGFPCIWGDMASTSCSWSVSSQGGKPWPTQHAIGKLSFENIPSSQLLFHASILFPIAIWWFWLPTLFSCSIKLVSGSTDLSLGLVRLADRVPYITLHEGVVGGYLVDYRWPFKLSENFLEVDRKTYLWSILLPAPPSYATFWTAGRKSMKPCTCSCGSPINHFKVGTLDEVEGSQSDTFSPQCTGP